MNETGDMEVLKNFTDILEQLGILYAIGGSMASSIYGVVRFTQDADITVEPFENQADQLYQLLRHRYYISREAMNAALIQRGSFNVIHLESAFKIDIFVRKDTAFEQQLILRRKLLWFSDSIGKNFAVVSPEDIVLLKLLWYRDGGQTSQRQWQDVLEILAVQKKNLDFEYLNRWAAVLGINDLFQKAVNLVGSG
ncbi:MAG: hypothetical protein NTW55_03345 [Planctomycetota bacterium]|nr:hypothetical protein [Planctomycetota bacterium]